MFWQYRDRPANVCIQTDIVELKGGERHLVKAHSILYYNSTPRDPNVSGFIPIYEWLKPGNRWLDQSERPSGYSDHQYYHRHQYAF